VKKRSKKLIKTFKKVRGGVKESLTIQKKNRFNFNRASFEGGRPQERRGEGGGKKKSKEQTRGCQRNKGEKKAQGEQVETATT